MAFQGNVTCQIVKPGPKDLYGRPTDALVTPARCGVVHLRFSSVRTSVRTDAAATRGSARERQAEVRLLFEPQYDIDIDYTVIVAGRRVRVVSIEPFFNVAGQLDHNRVECDEWQEAS